MAAPNKAAQEAESRARTEAGVDPSASVQALNPIDADGAPGTPPDVSTRSATVAEGEQPRPLPTVKGLFDDKRASIISDWRKARNEEVETQRDDITEFARSGMPPEFAEPNAPVIEPQAGQAELGQDQETADGAAQETAAAPEQSDVQTSLPPRVKVKVHGEEKEISLEEVIAKAQIAMASENILDEVKSLKRDLTEALKSARGAQPGTPPGAQSAQPPNQTDPAASETALDQHQDEDPIAKLIEAIQFGDPADARQMLASTIEQQSNRSVETALLKQRLRNEGVRTANVVKDFQAQHPELATDPFAPAAIEKRTYELQIEDLKMLGIDPSQLKRPDQGPVTAGDVAEAHKFYRAEGYGVRTPQVILETAMNDFLAWRGTGGSKEQTQTQPQSAKTAPRIDVTNDRVARREAIQQQPSRAVSPKPATPQAPQARDRSTIVQGMREKRMAPRGKPLM